MMHVIIGENLHDADYVANYTDGFDALSEACRGVSARARGSAHRHRSSRRSYALAREYATTRPAVIRLNYGVQRSERGGTAVRAIAALPALIGSWREAGGGAAAFHQSGAFNSTGRAWRCPNCSSVRRLAAKRAS